MPVVVLLIVLAVIVLLLAKSLQDARSQQQPSTAAAPKTSQARPGKPRVPRQRSRRRQPALDSDALAAHVAKLREAVETELISVDEAIDSIVRQTDGAVGPDAARRLLHQEDDAA